MQLQRLKPGDPVTAISVADQNLRADMIERSAGAMGLMPKPGIAGMFGFLGAFGAANPGASVAWGQLTYRSTGSAALSSGVTYKADALDGSIRITTAQAPFFRPYHANTRIIPAAADALCLLGWFPDPTTETWVEKILFVFGETNDPGECA